LTNVDVPKTVMDKIIRYHDNHGYYFPEIKSGIQKISLYLPYNGNHFVRLKNRVPLHIVNFVTNRLKMKADVTKCYIIKLKILDSLKNWK
jgi:hypothetical protein